MMVILSRVFWTIVIIIIGISIFHIDWILVPPFSTPHADVILVCPDGQYSIGEVCKMQPTGCPNGDSLPMDICYKNIQEPPVSYVLDDPVINWNLAK